MTHAAPLTVDPDRHAAEIERFFANVLKGPGPDDRFRLRAAGPPPSRASTPGDADGITATRHSPAAAGIPLQRS